MKIYTKTGDKGETSLFGGQRVPKDDLRIQSYGTVDELNAILGIVVSHLADGEIKNTVLEIQNDLFTLGADLATPMDKGNKGFVIPRVDDVMIAKLEKWIDNFDSKIPELKSFILPGGTKASSVLHFARTVCRRAERNVITLKRSEDIGDKPVIYLNRLSDLLFVLARYENHVNNTPDIVWSK